jgi:hypothetical protein
MRNQKVVEQPILGVAVVPILERFVDTLLKRGRGSRKRRLHQKLLMICGALTGLSSLHPT